MVGRPDSQSHGGRQRLVCRIAKIGLNLDVPRFPVELHIQVLHSHNRCSQQFHGVHDAADVVGATGIDGIGLAAACRRAECDAVQFFMRGIQDPHGQPIGRAGLERRGNVEFKRVFRALVLTYWLAVQPYLGLVVHGPETQDKTTVDVGIGRRDKVSPIPGHAVVIREDILNDPRHLGGLGIFGWSVEPLFPAADILGVGGEEPAFTVERECPGWLRSQRRGLYAGTARASPAGSPRTAKLMVTGCRLYAPLGPVAVGRQVRR